MPIFANYSGTIGDMYYLSASIVDGISSSIPNLIPGSTSANYSPIIQLAGNPQWTIPPSASFVVTASFAMAGGSGGGSGTSPVQTASTIDPAGRRILPLFPVSDSLLVRISAEASSMSFSASSQSGIATKWTGGFLTSITDLSGGGRHATNISGANMPRFHPLIFNGNYPGIAFNGFLSGTQGRDPNCIPLVRTFTSSVVDPFTVVLVMQSYMSGNGNANLYRDDRGHGPYDGNLPQFGVGAVGFFSNNNSWALFNGNTVTSTGSFRQNTMPPLLPNETAHACVRIDVYNNSSSLICNNGMEITVANPTSGTNNGISGTLNIGCGIVRDSPARFVLYEFLVYGRALNSFERTLLNDYYANVVRIPMI